MKKIKGHTKRAGNSIIIQPILLLIVNPHFLEECLPYGAVILIKKGKEIIPIIIQKRVMFSIVIVIKNPLVSSGFL